MVDAEREFAALREKLEQVDRRATSVSVQVDNLRELVHGLQGELRQDIKTLEGCVAGNGQKGLRLRIDRLERAAKLRRHEHRLLWGAIVAAAANALAAWLIR